MRKLFLAFILLSHFVSAQTPDATIKTNTNTWIRTAPLITGANEANLFDQETNSKLSRLEGYTASGTNTYTVSIGWISAYQTNLTILVKFTNANTGAATININGLGAKAIKKSASSALSSGDISAGQALWLWYDGTNFQQLGGSGGSGGGTWGTITGTLSSQGDLQAALDAKQDALVSGTNIKTVNSTSLLGSGDVSVGTVTSVGTSNGITGGTITGSGTISGVDAIADGSTKGVSSFTASDFNTSSGLVSLDYTNGQVASGSLKGFLTSSDWTTFNNKGSGSVTSIATTSPITGGTIMTTGTIACATCVTSAASLTSNNLVIGGGSQATSTTTTGTGVITALGVNTGSSGAFVVNGGALGTPSSGTLTNATGLPAASIVSGALANGMTATTQSANDNSTKVATTAYADAAAAATGTSTPTASTISKWDANKNMSAAGFIPAYTTTATAAGTTTLTVGSNQNQYFTGSTTQTVTLPVTSTLVLGQQFYVTNLSTGTVTVQSSGANTVQAMAANSYCVFTCVLTSGTTAASWQPLYSAANPMTAVGDVVVGGTVVNGVAIPSKISPSTVGFVLGDNGAGVAPSFQLVTSDMVKGTTTNSSATTGYIGEMGSSLIAVGSATSLTTATAKNITSVSLTAGNYIVWGNVNFTETTATVTARSAGISSTSATLPTDGTELPNDANTVALSQKTNISIPPKEFKLNGTTTIYLIGSATFSAGTNAGYGSLTWMRKR